MPIHKDLAAGRWFTLTYAEQMGNIGSEVERTIRAIETGDPEGKAQACARALELLDLTIADPRRTGEQEELRRLKETLGDIFQGENAAGTTFDSLGAIFWSGELWRGRGDDLVAVSGLAAALISGNLSDR